MQQHVGCVVAGRRRGSLRFRFRSGSLRSFICRLSCYRNRQSNNHLTSRLRTWVAWSTSSFGNGVCPLLRFLAIVGSSALHRHSAAFEPTGKRRIILQLCAPTAFVRFDEAVYQCGRASNGRSILQAAQHLLVNILHVHELATVWSTRGAGVGGHRLVLRNRRLADSGAAD